ncbi:MAG: tautomerase family protein [Fervidicoccaceae archaeon]
MGLPLVHVYLWTGASTEAKRRIIAGITKVFAELGIPPEAVEVLVHELPKENWGVAGQPASEHPRLRDARPP